MGVILNKTMVPSIRGKTLHWPLTDFPSRRHPSFLETNDFLAFRPSSMEVQESTTDHNERRDFHFVANLNTMSSEPANKKFKITDIDEETLNSGAEG